MDVTLLSARRCPHGAVHTAFAAAQVTLGPRPAAQDSDPEHNSGP